MMHLHNCMLNIQVFYITTLIRGDSCPAVGCIWVGYKFLTPFIIDAAHTKQSKNICSMNVVFAIALFEFVRCCHIFVVDVLIYVCYYSYVTLSSGVHKLVRKGYRNCLCTVLTLS